MALPRANSSPVPQPSQDIWQGLVPSFPLPSSIPQLQRPLGLGPGLAGRPLPPKRGISTPHPRLSLGWGNSTALSSAFILKLQLHTTMNEATRHHEPITWAAQLKLRLLYGIPSHPIGYLGCWVLLVLALPPTPFPRRQQECSRWRASPGGSLGVASCQLCEQASHGSLNPSSSWGSSSPHLTGLHRK